MNKYTYTVLAQLDDVTPHPIYKDGAEVGTIQRIYSNKLKKILDRHFDYRYFLHYKVQTNNTVYSVKKIFRRGKLWFEGFNEKKEKTIITYDNWRIGIPELKVIHPQGIIKIDKEIEEPSTFYEGDNVIATWHAVYEETTNTFAIELLISEEAMIQDPAFYIAISQATLFIGA